MCLLVTLTHVNQSVSQSIHKPVNHQVKYTNANKNRTVSPTGVQTQTKIQQSHQLDCRHKQKPNSLTNWTADTRSHPVRLVREDATVKVRGVVLAPYVAELMRQLELGGHLAEVVDIASGWFRGLGG